MKASNESSEGDWSEDWGFRTRYPELGVISPVSPLNNQRINRSDLSLSWTEEPNASSYQVLLSQVTSTGFVQILDTLTSATQLDLKNRFEPSQYRWQVRPQDPDGRQGDYTTPQIFYLIDPIGDFELIAPDSASTDVSITPTFIWTTADKADTYYLEVWEIGGEIIIEEDLTDTTFTSDSLLYSKEYGWYVSAYNSNALSSGDSNSEEWTFTTQKAPVGRVTTVAPADASTDVSRTQRLRWNQDENADSYQVQVSVDGFSTFLVDSSLSDTSLASPGYAYSTTYSWRVRAVNTSGVGEWSETRTFTTLNEPSLAPAVLISPVDGSIDISTDTLVRWSEVEGATDYTVQLSSDDFETLILDEQTDGQTSKTTFRLEDLDNGTEYSWRVRAKNSTTQGDWSQPWSFRTEYLELIQVSLLSPGNDSETIAIDTVLEWSVVEGATIYNIQVSTDGFSTFVVNDSTTNTSFALSELDYLTSYSWRVRAKNPGGQGEWSQAWVFTTQRTPVGRVTLVSPADGATDVSTTQRLRWNKDEHADTYQIQVSTDGFSTFVLDSTLLDTSLSSLGYSYSTTYSWRVRAINSVGDGQWSAVREFTTLDEPALGVPTLVSPANESTEISLDTVLSWSDVEDATAYILHVSSDGFNTLLLNESTSETEFSVSDLKEETEYSWRVRATNATDEGDWSLEWNFTTLRLPVEKVTLVSPADSATEVSISERFLWNPDDHADTYQIQISTDEFATLVMDSTLADTSLIPSGLIYSTSYHWRVRAKNSAGDGDWSDSRYFTTVDEPVLGEITLLTPVNGSTGISVDTLLTWNAVDGATNYTVQLSTDGFKTLVLDRITSTPSVRVSKLTNNTRYSWRVNASNELDTGDWSETWSFTTIVSRVGKVTLLSPDDKAINIQVTPTLRWQRVDYSDSYQVEVWEDTNLLVDSTITSTLLKVDSLEYRSTYSWRVRAINIRGEGEWSESRTFTTGTSSDSTIVLEIPDLISPIDEQQNVLLRPLFRWSHIPNSDAYQIQITTDFEFGSFDFETANLDTNSFTLPDSLEQSSVYYWRVKALGNQTYLDSDWSETFTFTTAISTTIREPEYPVEFSLRQNYPNPFNPVTKIQFSIPRATKVRVEVYTILGQTVAVLQNGLLASGVYTLDFDASNLSSGTYLYRIVTPEFSETKVMLLLK